MHDLLRVLGITKHHLSVYALLLLLCANTKSDSGRACRKATKRTEARFSACIICCWVDGAIGSTVNAASDACTKRLRLDFTEALNQFTDSCIGMAVASITKLLCTERTCPEKYHLTLWFNMRLHLDPS
eukprot:6211960-Pleurochrysis_carterae.AAC.4